MPLSVLRRALRASIVLCACPTLVVAQASSPPASPSLAVHGLVSASLFAQNQSFGFGNGQNAEWAAPASAGRGWFMGGDVRNTRLSLAIVAPEPAPGWGANATVEIDFFGGFNGAGAYSAEQPQPRLRLAYADLTHGRSTLRIGQMFTPLFASVPSSLSHVAFPLGLGAAGVVGWRQPGVLLLHTLRAPAHGTTVQAQIGAFRGTWSVPGSTLEQQTAGEASHVPQLEARLDARGRVAAAAWSGYAVAHYDEKRLAGVGPDTAHAGTLAGRAAEIGGRVAVGRLTVLGNAYRGRAMGQQFGHIAQFGDIGGWGGWAQAGWAVTPRLSATVMRGVDDPDDADVLRTATSAARLHNRLDAAQLRYTLGPYAVGAEWLRARTTWAQPGAGVASTPTPASQLAMSVLYTF